MLSQTLESANPPRTGRWLWFAVVSGWVLLADQLSKFWAVSQLTATMESLPEGASWWDHVRQFWTVGHPLHRAAITVNEHWFHFRYVENPGAAWGFLSRTASSWRTPFFLVLSLSAMGFIVWYVGRIPPRARRLWTGLTLVFGGALGNFIDRFRLGYVIDFVDWHLGDYYTWPTFNVADAAISVGVGLLLLDTLRDGRRG